MESKISDQTTAIRYYVAKGEKRNSSAADLSHDFWTKILNGLDAEPISAISHRQETYEVGTLTSGDGRKALYIGKRRTGIKAPLVSQDGGADLSSIKLSSNEQIVEAGVIFPVSASRRGIVGMFRTANGPTPNAVAAVLDDVVDHLKFSTMEHEFNPVRGENADSIIETASDISRLEVAYDNGVPASSIIADDPISEAVSKVANDFSQNVKIDVTVSYGGVKNVPAGGLIESLKNIFGGESAKKIRATARSEKDDGSGEYEIEHLDLIRDRIVLEVPIETSGDGVTPDSIFSSLNEAEGKLVRKSEVNPPRVKL